MSFTSAEFLLFLLGTLVFYGLVPKSFRWAALLLASYVFYALWNWQAIWVLALVTLSSYWTARQIKNAPNARARNFWLGFGLLVVLGSLFAFKYYDYVLMLLAGLLAPGRAGTLPLIQAAAPLGIAFFSLQVISYLVDVSRGQQEPATHLGQYALFVAFFPQLVSGPITRARKLLPQIEFLMPVVPEELMAAFHRLLWGGVQKFVIADRLSALTAPIFDAPEKYSSAALLGGLYLFAVQIYCDFAGYTNLALGMARLFGIELAENFRQPYFAIDFSDFWNRWHISLSNWLRDYIFYPVSRFLRKLWKGSPALVTILAPSLVTMIVSGIWHGVGPKFIVWGLMHGILIALAAATARWRKLFTERLGKAGWLFSGLQILVTFHLILISWSFFRLPGVGNALAYLRQIAAWAPGKAAFSPVELVVIALVLAAFVLLEISQRLGWDTLRLNRARLAVRWVVYSLMLFTLLFMGDFLSSLPFIYEQF